MDDRPEIASSEASTAERRTERREAVEAAAEVHLTEQELSGALRDLSSGGSFVTLDGDLEFELRYEVEGEQESRRVRLVRAQQLPGGRLGLAVEFKGSGTE